MMRLLRRLGRSRVGRPLLRPVAAWSFAHAPGLLPVQHLRETPTLLAFYHPTPDFPVHILIVPRAPRHALTDLTAADSAFLLDLVATVADLVAALDLAPRGYRLIANGGAYQDLPHLHFHLVAGAPPTPDGSDSPAPG